MTGLGLFPEFVEFVLQKPYEPSRIVEKYLAISGGYGRSAALADFGLDRDQTELVFAAFDEDYHISRYFTSAEFPAPPTRSMDSSTHTFPSTQKSRKSCSGTALPCPALCQLKYG